MRAAHPSFVFLAEAYWGTERRLHHLGFDYTYDKPLYDHLTEGRAAEVNAWLGEGGGRQRRAVRFIENHDEDRAAQRFPLDLHRVAALLALSLPGVRLWHHGQLEGARRKAPVQLQRRADEPVDEVLAAFYDELSAALSDPVLRGGAWRLIEAAPAWAGNPTHVAFVVYGWDGSLLGEAGDRSHRLLVANLATHAAQCRVPLTLPGLGARTVAVRELLAAGRTPPGDQVGAGGRPVYLRAGDEIAEPGALLRPARAHRAAPPLARVSRAAVPDRHRWTGRPARTHSSMPPSRLSTR